MERFYGTWKFVSYENFDDYLKGSPVYFHHIKSYSSNRLGCQ